jgi:tetratricopeptide (TPR) repeat protein
VNKQRYVLVGLALLAGGLLASVSCNNKHQPVARRGGGSSTSARQNSAAVLVEAVAKTLNSLPSQVVLDLVPAEPILDDSKSANQQPVLATVNVNPQDPEGGYDYLSVPAGNANFRGVGVRAGDIVRYFIKYDMESEEHGGGAQVGYIELPVRRLDTNNPNNALILDGSLGGPVEEPHRIEIWRFSDRRMNEIRLRLTNYITRRRPDLAWEPSPDETALIQLVDRANQWYRNFQDQNLKWQEAKLVETLPKTLRETEQIAPLMTAEALRDGQFNLAEVRSLQEAVWHRDLAAWTKHDAYEKLDVAKKYFDWTIRNIQLDDPDKPDIVYQPWQALMYGHGTAELRAWVFAELCRQQQIDAVILAAGDQWLVGVPVDGEFYLFDTSLGLPIPGAEVGKVATLSEVIANPELLRKLDLDAEHPYPLTAKDLQYVRAQVIATPLQMSRRAAALQSVLQGEDFVVLSADPDRLAESLKSQKGITGVELWPFPYESRIAEVTMKRPQREQAAQRFLVFANAPRLWKARVLYFQGTKPVPVSQQDDPLAQPRRGHREATQHLQHSEIRLPEDVINQLDPLKKMIYTAAKSDASYWLGLLSYELGKYEVAEDWFRRRTIESFPDGPWTTGATYNLARTLHQLNRTGEAIDLLEADKSPQQQGNRILARQWQEEQKPVEPAAE